MSLLLSLPSGSPHVKERAPPNIAKFCTSHNCSTLYIIAKQRFTAVSFGKRRAAILMDTQSNLGGHFLP